MYGADAGAGVSLPFGGGATASFGGGYTGSLQHAAQGGALAPPPPQPPPGPPARQLEPTATSLRELQMAHQLQAPSTAAMPQMAPMPMSGLRVHHEDCTEGSCLPPPLVALAPPGEGASAQQEFMYVQQGAGDGSRFRSVPKDRVRRSQRAGMEQESRSSSLDRTLNSLHEGSSSRLQGALDPDVAHLQLMDPSDGDIFELLVACARFEASSLLSLFLCQALLAGLTLAVAVLAGSTWRDDEELAAGLRAMGPGLGSLTLACAEFALVGSLFSLGGPGQRRSAPASAAGGGDTSLNASFSLNVDSSFISGISFPASGAGDAALPGEQGASRLAVRQTVVGCLHALLNVGLVVCCLAGGRANAVLAWGPWPGGGAWPAGLARSLLVAQPALAFAALVLAFRWVPSIG